ncbi:map [Symbiodinium microadriaticum]|nr:map [Symbiodinium microadriaticum]
MSTFALATEEPEENTGIIKIHDAADFEGMRVTGKLAAECLDMLTPHVKPGVTTDALDKLAHDFIVDHGAIPACLGYKGYPKTICTSVNHVVCHGIPGDKVLKNGDIVNIDVTTIVDGWHGDTSRMFFVGDKISVKARRLVDITYEAMMRGIAQVKPGATTGDIGHAIQEFAEGERCSVVRDFCGHGVGRVFHDAPNIVHYGRPGDGITLQEGMFFTVEPMINLGTWQVKMLSDGWTAVTRDRSLSAQFEHSIAVTADGYEIFTQSTALKGDKDKPGFADAVGLFESESKKKARLPLPGMRSKSSSPARLNKPGNEGKPHYHGHRDRLRARFNEAGPDALADYELLELILFRALPRGDVKPLAKTLIAQFGSFAGALAADPDALADVKGVGTAVITELKIAHAAALRAAKEQMMDQPILSSWQAVLDYCRTAMGHEPVEQFRVLFLDVKHRLIADEVQSKGTIDHTPVYPREVMKRALSLSAASIILVHNHPSGDPTPSRADIALTKEIVKAGDVLDVKLHDHIIISRSDHASFKDLGML